MTATPNNIQRLTECCICCDYLTDVRETPCCHQLFCQSCIQSWLGTSTKTCPRCRSTNLTQQTLLHNVVIQRFVDDLEFDCPNKLEGCPAKVPRSDLDAHKTACAHAADKLAEQRRDKLQALNSVRARYKTARTRPTDDAIYELAKSFFIEHEYQIARECLEMVKNKRNLPEMIILQAQIEGEDSRYDAALQFYAQAFPLAKNVPQRIEILLAKGQLYIKKAQYTQAKESVQQALNLLPSNGSAQARAEILNTRGLIAKKCSEVKQNLVFLVHQSPDLGRFVFQYDQAISAYNEALENVDVHSNLWSEIISNLAGRVETSLLWLDSILWSRYPSKERQL